MKLLLLQRIDPYFFLYFFYYYIEQMQQKSLEDLLGNSAVAKYLENFKKKKEKTHDADNSLSGGKECKQNMKKSAFINSSNPIGLQRNASSSH